MLKGECQQQRTPDPLHEVAGLEPVEQARHRSLERAHLGEVGQRDLDRRHEIAGYLFGATTHSPWLSGHDQEIGIRKAGELKAMQSSVAPQECRHPRTYASQIDVIGHAQHRLELARPSQMVTLLNTTPCPRLDCPHRLVLPRSAGMLCCLHSDRAPNA